ncbi:uncharacterized protein [Lolium perenne]|uniref:uncharacterized protein n=1 Tax=Lolium perenne TaxID=4522 RepID=UPI003A99F7E5
MAMAADWSSLTSDLVGLVADSLLASGDIDCYVSLRAVCHHWRNATADPRGPDPRFLPRRWVMLDSRAANVQDSRRLFLNVDTDNFVWKDLPVLRDYDCLAADSDGLLVLQGPGDSKKISALNPFTGAWIRFPVYAVCAPRRRAVAVGSSPMMKLYILDDRKHVATVDPTDELASRWIFTAKPALESFASVISFQGQVYAMDQYGMLVLFEDHSRITTIIADDGKQAWHPSFLVDNAGELLVVHAPVFENDIMRVFSVDLENKVLERINSIGNRAIFLGGRSLSVDADNLPTVEANCIYYIGGLSGSNQHGFYMFRLDNDGIEKPIEATDIMLIEGNRQHPLRPLSLTRILMDHANYGNVMEFRNLGAYM